MYLGIEQSTEMVFEGNGLYGAHVIWPLPLLTPAKFVLASDTRIVPAEQDVLGVSGYLFREDAFDPVTRIRRGRFYKRLPSQPGKWTVMVSPPLSANTFLLDKTALTFQSCHVSEIASASDTGQQIVILGLANAFSLWTVIHKELDYTNEVVVTLKSRQSFGALPEIDWGLVPDASGLVRDKLESLIDDVYRAGAESVIDRAREAAAAILSTYLQSEGVEEAKGKDLGNLIKLMGKKNGEHVQRIVTCAAEIPQRLHSRGKHAEQEKRDKLRPIREQDAELAVQCIGVMLCDLGWGRWM